MGERRTPKKRNAKHPTAVIVEPWFCFLGGQTASSRGVRGFILSSMILRWGFATQQSCWPLTDGLFSKKKIGFRGSPSTDDQRVRGPSAYVCWGNQRKRCRSIFSRGGKHPWNFLGEEEEEGSSSLVSSSCLFFVGGYRGIVVVWFHCSVGMYREIGLLSFVVNFLFKLLHKEKWFHHFIQAFLKWCHSKYSRKNWVIF